MSDPREITKILIDDQEVFDRTGWIYTESGEILIPKDQLESGDKLTVVYNEKNTTDNDFAFLSLFNKQRYKDLTIEAEIEFAKDLTGYDKNVEFIMRGINTYNKTFIIDQYYSFGIRNSRAYLAKTGYHEEGDNSYVYKQLLNQETGDTKRYFAELTDERQKLLNLDSDQFEYNTKYIFKCVLNGNLASFYVKETTVSLSQGIEFQWVPLFENVNIVQTKEDVSNRTTSLDTIVSVAEPLEQILDKGVYGLCVPNSHVRLYRIEVNPQDEPEVITRDDERYSKDVASEFHHTYRIPEKIYLNSSDSRTENTSNSQEFYKVTGNKVLFNKVLQKEDVIRVQANNLEMKKDVNYEDKFVDIQDSLPTSNEGSKLDLVVDCVNEADVYGQKDAYYELGKGDGLTTEFILPDEAIEKISNFPSGKVGEMLVQIDKQYITNTLQRVGLKLDYDKFIDEDFIKKHFAGREFYMKGFFRGRELFFDMGPISLQQYTYGIKEEYFRVNDSYASVWKYNLANWIDEFVVQNPVLQPDEVITTTSGFTDIVYNEIDISQWTLSSDTLGFVLAYNNPTDVATLLKSGWSPNFRYGIDVLPAELQNIIGRGMSLAHIRAILGFFSGKELISVYKELFLLALEYSDTLTNQMDYYERVYDGFYNNMGNYGKFRHNWIVHSTYNCHIANDNLADRVFYQSALSEEFTIDLENKKVVFATAPATNRQIVIRAFYNTTYNLTKDYQTSDTHYFVSDGLKELYVSSETEKGACKLIERYNEEKFFVINNGKIPYVVINKKYFDTTDQLYANLEICSPFIDNESVKRQIKLPLIDVEDLLNVGIDDNIYGAPFIPELTSNFSSVVYGTGGSSGCDISYHRENDYMDAIYEVREGNWLLNAGVAGFLGKTTSDESLKYSYSYPRAFHYPSSISISAGNVPTIGWSWDLRSITGENAIISGSHGIVETFFNKLFLNVVETPYIDGYLNVSQWFNLNDTKLGPYHRQVAKNIIDTKTSKRIYDERYFSNNLVNDDHKDIANWFDGFYSGKLTPWKDYWISDQEVRNKGYNIAMDYLSGAPYYLTSSGTCSETLSGGPAVEFGRFTGHPWGTQNSRKQMMLQLKNTLRDNGGEYKFSDYKLFYVDLSALLYYNRYTLRGLDASLISIEDYPCKGNNRLIDNPYIDPVLKNYVPFEDLFDDGEMFVFSNQNFTSFTDVITEYPDETIQAFPDLNQLQVNVIDVGRDLVHGKNLNWGFNTSIIFKDALYDKAFVNASYDYRLYDKNNPENSLEKISQKVSLGQSNGGAGQKFPNPDVWYRDNISSSEIHKIWLDNAVITDFNVSRPTQTDTELTFTTINPDATPDVAVIYDNTKYSSNSATNIFKDDFNNTRDFRWITLTKKQYGYQQQYNTYPGFVIDSTVVENEYIWKRSPLSTVDGDYVVKTGGTSNAKESIRVVQYGEENEDVLELIDLKRRDNFEISLDIYFDMEAERELMTAGIIFRGNFNFINDEHYLNEYYAVILNFEDSNIALIGKHFTPDGFVESQMLASVTDRSSIVKRGKFYTLRIKVVHDVIEVYLRERNQKERFYFSYNLKSGHSQENLEYVVDQLTPGGLGVTYGDPIFHLTGNRIGLYTRSDKSYFTNFVIKCYEENNLQLRDSFSTVEYDSTISTLKSLYNLTGDFKKLKKTVNGFVYILIGETMFVRRGNDETFHMHEPVVVNFEVVDENVYVHEILGSREIVNVYRGMFELQQNIVVDGKQFINEPIFSYLADLNLEIKEVAENNSMIFLTTKISGSL